MIRGGNPMNIQNFEKKEKNMATFEVKVPADVFDNAVNEVYKKNKSQLYVAGFRKGKAPRAVIEGMYGKDVFYPEGRSGCVPVTFFQSVMFILLSAMF